MHAKRWALACDGCGLFFVHPQPTVEALAAHYAPGGLYQTKKTARHSSAAVSPQMQAIIATAHRGTLKTLDRHFAASAPPPGARMLDYGCGNGAWLDTFQDHGWETFGIEPSSDAAFRRHRRLETIPTDASFDFVLMHHVLEHLPRPLDTLRALARAATPDGHCLVSVPRLDTLAEHRDVGYCLQSRTHVVGFTEACLTGLLARATLGVIAPLHDLDGTLTDGRPSSLRLLARQGAEPGPVETAAAAVQRVVRVVESISSE